MERLEPRVSFLSHVMQKSTFFNTSENPQVAAILVAILVIIHLTKPIFKFGQSFDKSSAYMQFGRNRVINDHVRVSTSAD